MIPHYMPQATDPSFKIYSKAKRQQWNAADRVDWTLPHVLEPMIASVSPGLAREYDRYFYSQVFLGEQTAMMACGRLLTDAPDIESRLYLASQVYDEARHTEVFGALAEKLGGVYRARTPFVELFEQTMAADLYEARILAVHVLVEGVSLLAFRQIHENTPSPLVAAIMDGVVEDEARHVGFGEVALKLRSEGWSKAKRAHLEGYLEEWWKLYRSGVVSEDPELKKLLPRRVLDEIERVQGERRTLLAEMQAELRRRLERYGLTLRMSE